MVFFPDGASGTRKMMMMMMMLLLLLLSLLSVMHKAFCTDIYVSRPLHGWWWWCGGGDVAYSDIHTFFLCGSCVSQKIGYVSAQEPTPYLYP